jgi:phosphotransferase system  glucose/maltose/N-acetylglucosamine-specific IIC component
MNEFVEQCRDEWKRLRVPEAIANEMAADLDADLEEARAEGTSAEDVLGRDAFDARAFAVKWAAARGVIPSAIPELRSVATEWRPRWRTGALVAFAVFALIAIFGAALAVHHASTSRAIAGVGPTWRFAQPVGPPMQVQDHAAFVFPVAFGVFLLLAGIAGAAVTIYYWSRNNRPGGPSYS